MKLISEADFERPQVNNMIKEGGFTRQTKLTGANQMKFKLKRLLLLREMHVECRSNFESFTQDMDCKVSAHNFGQEGCCGFKSGVRRIWKGRE